jgi:hypothetical protein
MRSFSRWAELGTLLDGAYGEPHRSAFDAEQ